MDQSGTTWQKWCMPYDPRLVDGTNVTVDEQGRFVETADCGTRCPGCGICCQGYRDIITPDDHGVEEHQLNISSKYKPDQMVTLEENHIYFGAFCGPSCPGYERCCPPLDMQEDIDNVTLAKEILLDRDTSTLSDLKEALVFLAHDGTDEAVAVLEQYLPKAHTKIAGFAECALDEGKYFNCTPGSEEERVLMMKQKVKRDYEDGICAAQAEIGEEVLPAIERLEYELEVVQRVKEKDEDPSEEIDWMAQIDVLRFQLGNWQEKLEFLRSEVRRNEMVIVEIERDIKDGPHLP